MVKHCIQKNGLQCISDVRSKEKKTRNFHSIFHSSVFKMFHIESISDQTPGIKVPFESPQDTCEKCVVKVYLKLAEKPPAHFYLCVCICLVYS